MAELTPDMITILILVAVTIFFFIADILRVDIVAMGVMVALPLTGILKGTETFMGFSSNAVISIIAVLIIGRGLDRSGIINRLMTPLIKAAGKSKNRIIIFIAATVAIISSFMQNTGAAALFLPAIRRVSRKSGIPISKILMPVAFSAILGGTVTLVGSSPLIMLNDLLEPYNLKPFNLFSVMPIGLSLVTCGILYFIFAGKFVLPDNPETKKHDFNLMALYPELGELYELEVPSEFEDTTVMDLCEAFNVHTVAMASKSGRDMVFPPDRSMFIKPDTVIAAYGSLQKIYLLEQIHGFKKRPELKIFAEKMSQEQSGVVEGLIPQQSKLIGKTIGDIRFRHDHLMTVLSFTRGNKTKSSGFVDTVLRTGDSLLLHGTWETFQRMLSKQDILYVQSLDHEVPRYDLAARALFSFILTSGLVAFSNLELSVCLMTGAISMILLKVIDVDDAYRSVDWRTVFLLGGLIPLGAAMQTTGTAPWIGKYLMQFTGSPPPAIFYLIVGVITTIFTLIISNVGAAVLLIPLMMDMAQNSGADPRAAALMVALTASNSFVLPTHQVNALYMGPGHYTAKDYIKSGTPMTIIFLIVTTTFVTLFY
ncbi:SLC13 family permease [Maridesulfovibrio bastinii]|uniref:SLC13 family permease n=1 Tax=Maridesulfovibrio bastinii TaxID=47157 RepID=UPI0004288890|nr:SLC13 family permease [Maridesulfovibrio bastinii]